MVNMKKYIYALGLLFLTASVSLYAGNPDRQGAAGATELLLNPWARSTGFNSLNSSLVSGIEAIRMNVGGLARMKNKTQLGFSHMIYLKGTDLTLNTGGFAQKMGENGAIGVELMSVGFGKIATTTVYFPDGDNTYYSPSFFNLGLSYSHGFDDKVFVGVTFRVVSQSIPTISSFGFGIDAGVQYVTGDQDNFKLGIALRNIGSPMKFSGNGLESIRTTQQDGIPISYVVNNQVAPYEMPSLLHMGMSYDFYFGLKNRLTALGNFTSNSFSRDQLGGGLEYSYNEMFMLRAAYKAELGSGSFASVEESVYSGLSAGFTFSTPLQKGSEKRLNISYGYLHTKVFDGCHSFGLTFDL